MPKDTRKLFIVFVTMALVLLLSGAVVYVMGARILRAHQLIGKSDATQAALDRVLQTVTDAETGQRGYLLTGKDEYLQPYAEAKSRIERDMARLKGSADHLPPGAFARIDQARQVKFAELDQTVGLHRSGKRREALDRVGTGAGQQAMGTSARKSPPPSPSSSS
jgi:CHASE3 domain sensor protein